MYSLLVTKHTFAFGLCELDLGVAEGFRQKRGGWEEVLGVCARSSVVIIPEKASLSRFRSYCRKPPDMPRSSSQRPEVGLVTIQDAPISRKYFRCRVKRLFWRYYSGSLRSTVVIIPPPPHPPKAKQVQNANLKYANSTGRF